MGLLDSMFGAGPEDPRSVGMEGLIAGLLSRNAAGGLLAGSQGIRQARKQQADDARKQQLFDMQLAQHQMQLDEAKRRQAAIEQEAQLQSAIPSLFSGGMSPGAFVPSADGNGPVMPQSAAPPAGFDVQGALRLRMKPDEIAKYAALQNIGRQKVARTVKGMGPDGKEYEYQVDEFGQKVGDGMAQYRAPISVNQGDRTTFADPYSLKPVGQFGMNQSPDSRASNAIAIRGQNMTDARAREANMAGRVPAGYRQTADGSLEFIPGGPADPAAARRAAPTEFQGKAGMFGARAAEADKIITAIEGKYSPFAVNSKLAADNAPWYLGGSAAGAVANTMLSKEGQMAEQAQRDFVNAVLRLESGAAVAESEFQNARKQYFPQPGDSKAVMAQKAQNRKMAIQGLMDNSRPGGAPQVQGAQTGQWENNDPLGLRK